MKINEAKKRKRSKLPYNSVSYTTGDIGLNINRFNQAVGSLEGSEAGVGGMGALAEDTDLQEAKRYVRRYYIRPQNLFCSNKAEIIKALIDIGNANCTIYTLNNLGDEKDVTKLMNNDIIYYYDEGILYDKNHVRIMDYDLGVKREEERKKLAKVDDDSKEFKDVYQDRMTSATELEENWSSLTPIFDKCDYDVIDADYTAQGEVIVSLNHNVLDIEAAAGQLIDCLSKYGMHVIDWNTNGNNVFIFTLDHDNAFDLDFDDVNVYGEKLTEAKDHFCCICGEEIEGYGNNPEPFKPADAGQCCDACNVRFVIPMRLDMEV